MGVKVKELNIVSFPEMDPLDFLAVRFHFGGEFINDGKALHYCGGKEGISSIERDKISLPEITGHLKDHFQATDPVLLHWLCLGKQLVNGLRALVDDKSCKDMCDCISDGGLSRFMQSWSLLMMKRWRRREVTGR